jgi:hypothetical protein
LGQSAISIDINGSYTKEARQRIESEWGDDDDERQLAAAE